MPGAVNVKIAWSRPGGGAAPTITSPAFLVAGTVDTLYPSTTFTATGTAPITWSVTAGTLPTGMAFSSAGVLSGTPTVTASGSITFTATNSQGADSRTLTLTVNAASVVANTMSLSLPTGTATNYPYQFGRVFKQGVIANFPQVLIDGVAQTTQADVKNRWPDGSVKFAVLSLVVPSLSTSAKTLTFQNQVSSSNTPETKANMLAGYDFNCTINATSGGSPITGAPAAARTILNAVSDATLASNTSGDSPNSRYWTQGPICTTVILCDHTAKTYDFGTDANKSLRPIFHVQFWPTLSQYRVRVIVEQADTTKVQSQTYDVSLSMGNASPSTVYTRAAVPHVYATRWTKTFWSGTAPVALNEAHNVGYLASTYALPNYDATITLSGTTASNATSLWAAASKDIYDAGLWTKYMPTTGGRGDIGPTTNYVTFALFSGSSGLWQVARGQADLSGAWPFCFRSGDERTFNTLTSDAGLGRFVTKDTHLTQFLEGGNEYMNFSGTVTGDKFTLGGVPLVNGSLPTNNGWSNDAAHQPDPYFAVYITTGDFWYLEQLQFWASWGLFISNPNNQTWGSGRSPADTVITPESQLRGLAWVFRNRARSAYASVDSSAEKNYLTRATEQALRIFEGRHIGSSPGGLAPTSGGLGDTIRNWWATNGSLPTPNPLRYWTEGSSGSRDNLNTGTVATGESPWMYSFIVISLGIGKDLGFGASEIFSWISQAWVSVLNESTVNNRYILQQYRYPVKSITPNAFYQNWTDVRAGYTTYSAVWDTADLTGSYAAIAVPAVAASYAESGGVTAWTTYNSDVYQLCDWASNPTWAVKPRT